jgi:uncharacterized protein (TIGR02145 family)
MSSDGCNPQHEQNKKWLTIKHLKKMKNQDYLIYPLLLTGLLSVFSGSCQKDDDDNGGNRNYIFTDSRDGNTYKTVALGRQVWMAENLRYLPAVTGPGSNSTTTPFYYVYGYNGTNVAAAKATANYLAYGVLYNWPAAMAGSESSTANPSGVQGVCPTGWHLPSDAEWIELENFLADNGYNYDGTTGGGRDKIAKAMAAKSGWTFFAKTGAVGNDDYPEYQNKSGFAALPGGVRWPHGNTFNFVGSICIWPSTSDNGNDNILSRYMSYGESFVEIFNSGKEWGYSVRCVKDRN